MIKANPLVSPIHLSTTYRRNSDGSYDNDFVYSSIDNPNRRALETELAKLEFGKVGFAFASGMAAIHAVLQSLHTGDHVLLPSDAFYQVRRLLNEVYGRWGLQFSMVDMSHAKGVKKAIRKNTKLIWVETPSNPLLDITDIQSVADIAGKNNCLLAVDNTWASPTIQNPLQHGADIVMHSTTKYLGGHHDVIGGCIVLKEEGPLANRIRGIQKLCGGVPSPLDCWLISRGIKTLEMRVRQQSQSAMKLAEYLQNHHEITDVFYPGLSSHPNHKIARKQMHSGFGGMLSVLVKGGDRSAVEISNKLQSFVCATSLGGVDSLIEHRNSVEGADSRAPANLLRMSIGIEPFDLLRADWEQVLISS